MTKTILVVEDTPQVANLLRTSLEGEGFRVITLADGLQAAREAARLKPDLVILDVGLPGIDGLEVCRRLRSDPSTARVAVMIVSGKGEEMDKVIGLEVGANDYLAKPFGMRELIARARALLRRGEPSERTTMLQAAGVELDLERHLVLVGGKRVTLTSKEFGLLRALMESRGRVLKREYLLEHVWGYDAGADVESRTIDAHVASLRRKLGRKGRLILTVRGVGYRFEIVPEWVRSGLRRTLSE